MVVLNFRQVNFRLRTGSVRESLELLGMTTQSLRWLDLPVDITGDRELQKTYYEQLLQDTEDFVNPMLAKHFRAMDREFSEWKTEGINVISHNGEAYFDALGAGGVFGLGYRHPKVIEAVKQQLERTALSCRFALVPAAAALGRKMAEIAPPGLTRSWFGNSGTEVVEAAIKLARLATGKPGLIGTHFGYHGLSIGTLSLSGLAMWREGTGPMLGSSSLVPFNDLKAMEAAISDDTAAVVLEPVQWASGCEIATKEYLEGVRKLCDKHGALLIYDEIQCGLGRTGQWWAYQATGVHPDMICCGKVLSGGVMPIGAVLYGDRVYQAEMARPLFNNSSYGGNSLSCAAGYATLEVLEQENLIERSRKLGERVNQAFAQLAKDFPKVVRGQRGIGLMTCLEMVLPQMGILLQDFVRIDHQILIASMIHMPQLVRISPPFICTDEDIERLLSAIRSSVEKIGKMKQYDVMAYFADIDERHRKVMNR